MSKINPKNTTPMLHTPEEIFGFEEPKRSKAYSSYFTDFFLAKSFQESLKRLGIESLVNPYDMGHYYYNGNTNKPCFEMIISL